MGGAKKDPNAPKRPLSAYFIFMGLFDHVLKDLITSISGEKRAEVKAANPDWKIGDVAKSPTVNMSLNFHNGPLAIQ